jgi:membrane associated rhomboid family serine protease
MILPISHERMTARRWPIVTTFVFAACLLVQVVWPAIGRGADARIESATRDIAEYVGDHPYLQVPPGAAPDLMDEELAKLQRDISELTPSAVPDDDTRRAEQEHLQELIAELDAARRADPLHRFGFVPADRNWGALLTYSFVHSGWLHLAGNMWFLFLVGMNLEDRWGRLVFPLFYVAAGVVAGLAHMLMRPHDALPLIGASGAVAGAMGAFAIIFAKTRVRFAALIGFRVVTFTAPALVMLLVWAAFEALWALVFTGDGTAHWAHVGGFAFGLGAALLLRRTGFDHKLDDAVERVATLGDDPRIESARLLVTRGNPQQALAMLEGLAVEKPRSVHVHEAIAEVARALGDDAREQKARQRADAIRASTV